MQENKVYKISGYLFIAFCAYISFFVCVVVFFQKNPLFLVVPIVSFVVMSLVMKCRPENMMLQAYTMGVFGSLCVYIYGIMTDEFTEVFMVYTVVFCLISCYRIVGVHYLMVFLYTLFLLYEIIWEQEWRGFLEADTGFVHLMRITSVYLGQFLIISFIKKQISMQEMLEQKAREAEKAAMAKEDFLANISHEIRTPMNAISGMVELILRSDRIPPQEKDYLYNIESASDDLLRIIDDILDFTMIDKGDMEIVEERYEITSIVHDVSNVIKAMLEEKPVTLNVDLDPKVPVLLKGDSVRIKQIIMKLLGNAVKYTEKGTITFRVWAEPIGDSKEKTILKVDVEDTGIGVPEDKLAELFAEFSQGNSARNRTAGGSGLGLAISKSLVELMNGKMHASSQVGKGSVFGFELEQQVIDAEPCINTEKDSETSSIQGTTHRLGDRKKAKGRKVSFTAPEVRTLIVDDNKVNLRVAEGLLRPYRMTIETANSGMQAIEMVQTYNYDLIFMDHMMPVMDGVEATQKIRNLAGEQFHNVPIIALSANAVRGAKEIFLEAGMNDFVAKPIEMKIMDRVLRRWLPPQKVITSKTEAESEETIPAVTVNWQMRGIDTKIGLEYSDNSAELYREILFGYMDCIHEKADTIENAFDNRDLETYTIEVHSLKSTSRSVGATELSELAGILEEDGKSGDWDAIIEKNGLLLSMYRDIYDVIKPYYTERDNDSAKKPFQKELVRELLDSFYASMENFDSLSGEELVKRIGEFDLPAGWTEFYSKLVKSMNNFDYTGCKEIVKEWEKAFG